LDFSPSSSIPLTNFSSFPNSSSSSSSGFSTSRISGRLGSCLDEQAAIRIAEEARITAEKESKHATAKEEQSSSLTCQTQTADDDELGEFNAFLENDGEEQDMEELWLENQDGNTPTRPSSRNGGS